ncbi:MULTISPECIES: DoxX family protein [Tsukamurella]|uniref:DoxX family protein n=1 Tax=Tsukamurella columbiensis TaxID=128509 RepID=A0ABX1LB19_9ACTN|nr:MULTISPECIES: DoxX family protein [Tsukamurella]NMD54750.1 DoxX family protein [Tsukamurella columbiensis]
MSDKDGTENETSEGAGESPFDFRSTGELPRFGERHPTGGFILDPHDDSDTGIGPVLPRYRDEPAGTTPADPPAASSAPTAASTPAAATPAPSGGGEPAASVPDTSDLAAAIAAANAATAAISTSGTPGSPDAATERADLSSDERDEFGKRYNRRRGRERAAQARAEAEGIPLETAATEQIAPPPGRRFGKPVADVPAELEEARKAARRGTTDLGLLVLRVAVGVILVAHGIQKLFGIWGGPGIDGFAAYLQNGADPSLGFERFTKIIAIATGVVELGGGAMLILGLLTPIAAAGAVGVMLSATLFKLTTAGNGFVFFAQDKGVEFELLLLLASVAIILTGPGRLSLDFNRGWARRPHIGSVVWLVVAVAAAVTVWILLNGANPLVKQ